MTVTTTATSPGRIDVPASSYAVFGALTGLTAVAVVLQGLWAGLFLETEGTRPDTWVNVHALGAHAATALAVLALVWAVWKLRSRTDLWVGSLLLAAVIVAESYIGGLIRDQGKDTLTAVHVPLAMITLALVVWLPLRARSARREL